MSGFAFRVSRFAGAEPNPTPTYLAIAARAPHGARLPRNFAGAAVANGRYAVAVTAAVLDSGVPKIGDVIDGKYRVVRALGEGGMGVVFEATHLRMGQRVAIKVLKPSAARTADVLSRFDREARAACRLNGRHAARVLDVVITADHLPYMVMEYLEGRDLQCELERRRVFPVDEAVDYVLQACRGMAEAHDIGVVHRDLKPSNLFLCDEGDRRVVKILDFGISKILDEASKLTSTELTVGTPLYMSPEQVRSARTVDARTDVWALGIILYELLSGRPPWVGSAPSVAAAIVTDPPPPLSEFRGDVPAGIQAAIERALAKKVDERFAGVRELATALTDVCPSVGDLGRVSLESARRAAAGARPDLIAAGSDPELANAATVLSYKTRTTQNAEPFARLPAPSRPKSFGWATGSSRRAKPPYVLFGAALLAAVAGVSVAFTVASRRADGKAAPAGARPTPSDPTPIAAAPPKPPDSTLSAGATTPPPSLAVSAPVASALVHPGLAPKPVARPVARPTNGTVTPPPPTAPTATAAATATMKPPLFLP